MSIAGLTWMARLTLAAGGMGIILIIVLYWKLQIRKACHMLWGIPMKQTISKEKKPAPKIQQTEKLTQDTQVLIRNRDVRKAAIKPDIKYEQTYIHTHTVIE